MAGELLPSDSIGAVLLNIASVIILFGPAYLANTGAMLFGKWIPEFLARKRKGEIIVGKQMIRIPLGSNGAQRGQ